MDNRVKKLREKLGLTQAALARKAGTSQQQIQRIEAGQAARLDLALRVCAALDQPMDVVFPKTKKALKKVDARSEAAVWESLRKREVQDELGKAGIDAEPEVHILKLRLLSGVEKCYSISSQEKHRLWGSLQEKKASADEVPFVVFDADHYQVAVNVAQLAYWHFLFEAPHLAPSGEEEFDRDVNVYFVGSSDPLALTVEPDPPPPQVDDDDDEGQLRHILQMLDIMVEAEDVFGIEDEDGETAFLRSGSVALLEVPQALVLEDDHSGFEDDEDSEEAPGAEPTQNPE